MAQLVKIFCRENISLNLSIRNKKLVLARADSRDKSQQWFRDYSSAGNVADDEGHRAFALVNKATGEALLTKKVTHGSRWSDYSEDAHPVYLAPYKGDELVTLSMLWTEGQDLGDGFREVRVLKDTSMTLNGLGGNVKDGTDVGIHPEAPRYGNAVWKILDISD